MGRRSQQQHAIKFIVLVDHFGKELVRTSIDSNGKVIKPIRKVNFNPGKIKDLEKESTPPPVEPEITSEPIFDEQIFIKSEQKVEDTQDFIPDFVQPVPNYRNDKAPMTPPETEFKFDTNVHHSFIFPNILNDNLLL